MLDRDHRLLLFTLALVFVAIVSPRAATADAIVIADLDLVRVDDSGTTFGIATLIVEDDVMLLDAPGETIPFEENAVVEIIIQEIIAGVVPKEFLSFELVTAADSKSLSFSHERQPGSFPGL